jgi:hypothetical protein
MIKEHLVISCLGLVVLVVLLSYCGNTLILAWGDFPPELKIVLAVITLYFLWRLKMAILNLNEIEDFSELGKDYTFKYDNKYFSIPPIPPFVAKKLMKGAREYSKEAEDREVKIKQFQKENEELPVEQQKIIPIELLDASNDFYDFQIEFILTSGIIQVNESGSKVEDVTKEFIEGSEEKGITGWSTQLVMKIFKKVNEIISVEQEKKS